jgi:hypothetical protein
MLTYEQFEEISVRLLGDRYKLPQITAIKIAIGVWNQIHSKDVRDVLKIGKLAKPNETDTDIKWLIETYKKYSVQEGKVTEFN